MLGDDLHRTLTNFGGFFQWPVVADYEGDKAWPYTFNGVANMPNPLALLYNRDEHANSRSLVGSADIDYKVHGFEDLRLHLTAGADISEGRQYTNNDRSYTGSIYYGSNGRDKILKRNLQISTYAQYYKDFAKIHHFDIMGGYEWQHFWRDQKNDYISTYPITSVNAGKERPHTPYHFQTDSYLVSFFGRANYTLLDRYMLTATVRHDGSSRFKEHWATFPSFAFAWKINEEPFLRSAKALSDLKLRLSYGQTGQQAGAVPDYSWIATYTKNKGDIEGMATLKIPGTQDKEIYISNDNIKDAWLTIPISEMTKPGEYKAQLQIKDENCGDLLKFDIDFKIYYPQDIFSLKYNNVLAVYASGYGGNTYGNFTSFQWYHNGALIPGATSAVYHTDAPFKPGDTYYVELSDGVATPLPACPLTIPQDVEDYNVNKAPSAEKKLINRHMYIVIDNRMYDAYGLRVK